jgi:hypothetical protein
MPQEIVPFTSTAPSDRRALDLVKMLGLDDLSKINHELPPGNWRRTQPSAIASKPQLCASRLRAALAQCNGSRVAAAGACGVSLATLKRALQRNPEIAAEFPAQLGRPTKAQGTCAWSTDATQRCDLCGGSGRSKRSQATRCSACAGDGYVENITAAPTGGAETIDGWAFQDTVAELIDRVRASRLLTLAPVPAALG